MKYKQYRDQRIDELLHTGRWPYVMDKENDTKGLLDLIKEVKPTTVLEIGSLRGVSTELFLLNARRVLAIDIWESEYIFAEFLENCGYYPNIEIIRAKSPEAVDQIQSPIKFDLAYIDGDHTYDAVKADIEACKKVALRLSGHDYNIPDVQKAVDEVGKVKVFSETSWLITEMY